MNWQELANQINATHGYHLITINFMPELRGVAFQHYQRASILRVVLHENLFSIHLGWQAIFHPFSSRWLWIDPPKAHGVSVQIIDGDITDVEPLVVEEGLIRITHEIWTGMLMHTPVNPAGGHAVMGHPVPIGQGISSMSVIETGRWVIAPNYRGQTFDTSLIHID